MRYIINSYSREALTHAHARQNNARDVRHLMDALIEPSNNVAGNTWDKLSCENYVGNENIICKNLTRK